MSDDYKKRELTSGETSMVKWLLAILGGVIFIGGIVMFFASEAGGEKIGAIIEAVIGAFMVFRAVSGKMKLSYDPALAAKQKYERYYKAYLEAKKNGDVKLAAKKKADYEEAYLEWERIKDQQQKDEE